MPLYDNCSLMVVPITCDCKKKLAGYLSRQCEVCTLQVPASKEDEDVEQYVRALYQFIGVLEQTHHARCADEERRGNARKHDEPGAYAEFVGFDDAVVASGTEVIAGYRLEALAEADQDRADEEHHAHDDGHRRKRRVAVCCHAVRG